jgi:hypothetical protein
MLYCPVNLCTGLGANSRVVQCVIVCWSAVVVVKVVTVFIGHILRWSCPYVPRRWAGTVSLGAMFMSCKPNTSCLLNKAFRVRLEIDPSAGP